MQIILGHEARIRRGQTSLGQLCISESDDSSSRKMGDLGIFFFFLEREICKRSSRMWLSNPNLERSAGLWRPLLDYI